MSTVLGNGNITFGDGSVLWGFTGNNEPTSFAVGDTALLSNLPGSGLYNTAVGIYSLYNNLSGQYNTAAGWGTLAYNGTGVENTAVGYGALNSSTSGSYNVAFGASALAGNIVGNGCTAIGYNALQYSNSTNNTGIGYGALAGISPALAVGWNNTAVGSLSLLNIAGGYDNTTIGYNSGSNIYTGNNNIAIGSQAMAQGITYNAGSFIVGCGYVITNSGNTSFTNAGATANTVGTIFIATGPGNATTNGTAIGITTGRNNTAVGTNALTSLLNANGNVSIGATAMLNNTTGYQNTAIGNQCMRYNTTGANNTSLGSQTLGGGSMNGNNNTAVGYYAGNLITSGSGNVILGGFTAAGVSSPAVGITTQNDYISIGSTSTTSAQIHVAWTVTSDIRDKTNFQTIPHGLDFVNGIETTSYQFTHDRITNEINGPVRYGFKAQQLLELEGNNPVIIDKSDSNKLKYNESCLIPVLVNAIQELTARLAILEGK